LATNRNAANFDGFSNTRTGNTKQWDINYSSTCTNKMKQIFSASIPFEPDWLMRNIFHFHSLLLFFSLFHLHLRSCKKCVGGVNLFAR
jgi:hypothetical protein